MFEQGVIRPPSEAESLLVRVTRNCPWNRCHICPAYKGKKFSTRSVDEVMQDIDNMAKVYASHRERFRSAFLQYADTLILPTQDLIDIIGYIKRMFPGMERITTYARAKSMKRKSGKNYESLKHAGLTRIHSGMESGSLKVLKLIRKGINPDDIIIGGKKVRESDISLSEYIMPGVGGREYSREHALETARLLNIIRPDFIRVRTFAIHPLSPLQKMVDDGMFTPMDDEEVVKEIRLILENLDEMPARFRCGDFSLNLLMNVDGHLDTQKESMIREIDRYLALTQDQKKAFSLLQRTYPGNITINSVRDEALVKRLRPDIDSLEKQEKEGFNKYIRMLMSRQIPQLQTDCWE